MDYQSAVRGKKLAFKSASKQTSRDKPVDKLKHKYKRKRHSTRKEETGCWVPVQSKNDLEGPLAIYFQNTQLHIFSLPPKVETQTLADEDVRPPGFYTLEGVPLVEAEPLTVEQVFVGRRSVPATGQTDEQSNMYSFKSCRNTYLSATKHGEISCSSVAIGPLEMWTPVLLPEKGDGSVALKIGQPSSPDKDYFLSASASFTDRDSLTRLVATQKQYVLAHTHATAIGADEVFTIKHQAALRRKRHKSKDITNPIPGH